MVILHSIDSCCGSVVSDDHDEGDVHHLIIFVIIITSLAVCRALLFLYITTAVLVLVIDFFWLLSLRLQMLPLPLFLLVPLLFHAKIGITSVITPALISLVDLDSITWRSTALSSNILHTQAKTYFLRDSSERCCFERTALDLVVLRNTPTTQLV